MTEKMKRRTFLQGTVALSTGVAVAGCGGGGGDDGDGGDGSDSGPETDLSYGDTVEGEITEDTSRDPEYNDLAKPYTFQGQAGDIADISMSSGSIDTYLLITGPDGEVAGENDDTGQDTDSRLVRGLTQDGVYTIWAGSFSGEETGSFTLSLSRGERSYLVPDEATSLSFGESVEGVLRNDAPTDPLFGDPGVPYTFEGSEGASVTVTMASNEVDAFLLITDENGREVAQNDDGGQGTNSQLTTTLPRDGTYVIWAESLFGNESGSFTLSLSESVDA